MNIRNDFQPVQSISSEIAITATEKPSSASVVSADLSGNDQTHLSFAASLIGHAASVSDMRSEKIQSVQSAIANGNYHVNAVDVAQSLIGHMLGEQD